MSTVGVGQASASEWVQWATNHGIKSGESVFGPKVELIWNLTEPAGVGIICPGIRNEGLICPPEARAQIFEAFKTINSEPYAHDHSTFTSGFSAKYKRTE